MLRQNNEMLQKIKNLLSNKYVKNFYDLALLFILIKFVMSFIIPIKEVISYNINHQFEYEYQKNVVKNILYSHTILLYTPIFLSMICLFKRKIGFKEFTISFLLGYFANEYGVFNIIHNFLETTPIFDILRQNGRTTINNQYTRIIFYFINILLLLFLVARKKTRTLSRIMILLITSSCLFTVSIFHVAIPMGMFKAVQKDKADISEYEIKNYPKEVSCENKNCYEIYFNGKVKVIKETKELGSLNEYSWVIDKGNYLMNKNNKDTFAQAVNIKSEFLFEYNIMAMKKEDNHYFVTIDPFSMRKFSRESEITFAFLATLAHFIWIFGGLILLEFHYYKFNQRRKIAEK